MIIAREMAAQNNGEAKISTNGISSSAWRGGDSINESDEAERKQRRLKQ
jgi:hypothetical protein